VARRPRPRGTGRSRAEAARTSRQPPRARTPQGWASLTPGYRAYLARRGITEREWLAGTVAARPRSERAWESLDPTYRQRLARAGLGREEWRAGFNLRRLPPPPSPAELGAIAERVVAGTDSLADVRAIQRWQAAASTPEWLRRVEDPHVALAFRTLPDVETWDTVRLKFRSDGSVTMTVADGSGDEWDLELSGYLASLAMLELSRYDEDDFVIEVVGT
jgi:hypothetical protein